MSVIEFLTKPEPEKDKSWEAHSILGSAINELKHSDSMKQPLLACYGNASRTLQGFFRSE